METTTYVVQRRETKGDEQVWLDAGSPLDNEADAHDLHDTFVAKLGEVLGPFRLVRRTETVI